GIDRPDSRTRGGAEEDTIQDLASLLKTEKSLQMTPVDVGGSGLSTIAVSELGGGDVVGTSGMTGVAGESGPGFGSGMGDRDVAGGGPVGTMWGVGKGQKARSVVY